MKLTLIKNAVATLKMIPNTKEPISFGVSNLKFVWGLPPFVSFAVVTVSFVTGDSCVPVRAVPQLGQNLEPAVTSLPQLVQNIVYPSLLRVLSRYADYFNRECTIEIVVILHPSYKDTIKRFPTAIGS